MAFSIDGIIVSGKIAGGLAATVPASPTGATATGGNAQATVTFTAPADGGSPITGYTVVSSPAGGTDTNAGTTSLSHVVTGLTNGVAYTFQVYATNILGNGPNSANSNSITPIETDPYYSNVSLLLHGDGTNSPVVFAGNARVSSTQSKFGGSSIYLDGTGDYLTSSASSTLFAFGTGDFTIETWFYATSTFQGRFIYDGQGPAFNTAIQLFLSGNEIRAGANNSTSIVSPTLISTNTWYHVALVRSSGVIKMYLNGSQTGQVWTNNTNYTGATNRPSIGAKGSNLTDNFFQGYFDEYRVTKGVARYTANFTPQTAAFPDS